MVPFSCDLRIAQHDLSDQSPYLDRTVTATTPAGHTGCPRHVFAMFVQKWRRQSLATQFALAGGAVLLLSALLIGSWVSSRIEGIVVRNTANATALYMESFISPLSQDLAVADVLSPGAYRALDEIFDGTALGERVVSFKIWNPAGKIVASSDPEVAGKSFPVSAKLQAALAGDISASFEKLGGEESAGEQALDMPLLEIYSPIREVWSGKIIGVTEFYEVGTDLQSDLIQARRTSWGAVTLILSTIGGLLYSIVRKGSNTIARQSSALNDQLGELRALADRNRGLRQRVQQAASRASAMNDRALRRIGADLHDGPAQLLGFSALRLDSIRRAMPEDQRGELETIERAVKDAIREIRTISKGLSLPDIETRDTATLIRSITEAHAARTGTDVALDCDLPDDVVLPAAVKICLYRFVQEGLSNAWRYAEGKGQSVQLSMKGPHLTLVVADSGPGYPAHALAGTGTIAGPDGLPEASDGSRGDFGGMGLSGLRDRVESLGGTMTTGGRPDGHGAVLKMELDMRLLS